LTLALCCAIVGVATVLTGAATGIVSLFILRLALGFGEGAGFPTATRAMASWDAAGKLGIRARHRAFVLRASVTHSRRRLWRNFGVLHVARLFRDAGRGELLWLGVWTWYFRNDPREHFSITPELLAKLPVRARRGPIDSLAAARAPYAAGNDGRLLLWMDAVAFLTWIPAFFFENYHQNLQASALFSGACSRRRNRRYGRGFISDRLLRKTGSLAIARAE